MLDNLPAHKRTAAAALMALPEDYPLTTETETTFLGDAAQARVALWRTAAAVPGTPAGSLRPRATEGRRWAGPRMGVPPACPAALPARNDQFILRSLVASIARSLAVVATRRTNTSRRTEHAHAQRRCTPTRSARRRVAHRASRSDDPPPPGPGSRRRCGPDLDARACACTGPRT